MAQAVSNFKDGFAEWSDAMMLSYNEMTSKMGESSKTLDARLSTLSANFGTSFKAKAIPALTDTKKKTDELTNAIGGNDGKSAKNKVDELAKRWMKRLE